MVRHRRDYVQWKNGNIKVGKITRFELFEKFGVEICRIVLFEMFPCSSRDELTAREATIQSLKCVNKMIPHRTQQEYQDDNRIELLQKKVEYYNTNKEDINKRKNQLVICECGCSISKNIFAKHKKSQKHADMMFTINILSSA
jgi:hypothetical protein